jgi:hypothetical protein
MPLDWTDLIVVRTGGQDGVDLACWEVAKELGFPTSGWMPKGFRTAGGPRPEYQDLYCAQENSSGNYADRTVLNVEAANMVVVLTRGPDVPLRNAVKQHGDFPLSPGTSLTLNLAYKKRLPVLVADLDDASSWDLHLMAMPIAMAIKYQAYAMGRIHSSTEVMFAGPRDDADGFIYRDARTYTEAILRKILEQ